MSRASRRRARQARRIRTEAALARVAQRQADVTTGTRSGPRVWTRKDREAVSIMGGGRKQRTKHQAKRLARREVRRQVERAALQDAINNLVDHGAPARPTSVRYAGSSVPYIAYGTAVTADGREYVWDFRYRYDRAFLEVGTPDPDDRNYVGEAMLSAWRDDVAGEPYKGWLTPREAVHLLAELFCELTDPGPGTRFAERLTNTVDLTLGGGNPDAPHLIRIVDA